MHSNPRLTAERMRDHRQGVARKLDQIVVETSALKSEIAGLREVIESALVRKSIAAAECHYAD
jgi:hypothetical protein